MDLATHTIVIGHISAFLKRFENITDHYDDTEKFNDFLKEGESLANLIDIESYLKWVDQIVYPLNSKDRNRFLYSIMKDFHECKEKSFDTFYLDEDINFRNPEVQQQFSNLLVKLRDTYWHKYHAVEMHLTKYDFFNPFNPFIQKRNS